MQQRQQAQLKAQEQQRLHLFLEHHGGARKHHDGVEAVLCEFGRCVVEATREMQMRCHHNRGGRREEGESHLGDEVEAASYQNDGGRGDRGSGSERCQSFGLQGHLKTCASVYLFGPFT
jgi:hypothetical protein